MENQKSYPMTAEGKEKLQKQLEDMKMNKRPQVIDRIKIARSYGDLSENSEYESAKDEQSMLESQISSIEHQLQYAEVIDNENTAQDEVTIGKKVTFKELPDEEPEEYTIVGAAEADPMSGKISNESPIAKALLNHKINDEVSIETPGGDMKVQIIKALCQIL
ncbi:transcription elongation factor GreA, partial [Secundilactobacillus malefermentans]